VKRILATLGLVACITLQILPNANAATKPNLVLKGFQSYVSIAKSALTNAKINYDNTVATINATYASSVLIAKTTFDRETLVAKNLYEPKINASNQIIRDAKAKLLTVNQVRVLKQGTDRNKWGYLNCPTTRQDCKYVDKGELFVIGESTTLKSFVGDNVDYLRSVQFMIDEGLIELLNLVEFQKASNLISTEPDKIKSLTAQWDSANALATTKQSKALDEAKTTARSPLSQLMQNYESDKLVFGSQITAGNTAIRAAKRASKNPSVFDKAFVTAYKFEYNVKGLDDIANLSFSSLNTLRSFLSQFAIIELADKASGIDASYNYLAAEKINKSVGDVFTSDEEFQEPAKLVASQYKKLTKVTLKF
jgi:hypothetical protein